MLANGLAWGNAGNLSARLDPGRYLITASGTRLGELDDADLVEVSLVEGQPGPQGRKPSKEMPMHRAVYEIRPEIQAVLHASPFYSTLLACAQAELPADWFVEAMYYLERVERVPYFHPGSLALGEGVREKAGLANILLLENHGVLVYDTSVREALMGLHTLEMVSRMWVTARSAGIEMHSLSPGLVKEFLENSGYRPRRKWLYGKD
jgi:L-fuculose-phosphate aldolase